MKTTVEIPDALLAATRRLAAEERTTIRELIEQGLREVLASRARTRAFQLRQVTFPGTGLTAEFEGASWDKVRDAIYEGHGS